jgi:hypothetical protein
VKWTEADVLDVLREAYLPVNEHQMDEWALLPQVALRCLTPAGLDLKAKGGKVMARHWNERRIDALAVRCWSTGRGFERIAFEVKVSRADFRNETEEKRAPAEAVAHMCTYVAPAGVIPVVELPPGWGLIEVYETPADRPLTGARLGDRGVWVVKPKRRTPWIELDGLTAVLARRASRAEESIRSASGGSPAEVARLRHENDRLSGLLYSAQQQIDKAKQAAREARFELLAQAGEQVCADCDQKITWKASARSNPVAGWAHVDKRHEIPCQKDRREKDRLAKEAATGAQYSWGFAAPVEPKAFRELRQDREQLEQEAS